jgi:hypothetical protein
MAPSWLALLAWIALAGCGVCAGWIIGDIYVTGHRQRMSIMEVVWPVNALYFGPLAVWAYRRWGRPQSPHWRREHGNPPDKPRWATTSVGVMHCALALALGIVFQYFAIAPMRGLSLGKGLWQAAKADVLSLTAFEVGLFGWMALTVFVLFPGPHLHPNDPVYWFLMQIGMAAGFLTAYPVNAWLIRRGIKEAM